MGPANPPLADPRPPPLVPTADAPHRHRPRGPRTRPRDTTARSPPPPPPPGPGLGVPPPRLRPSRRASAAVPSRPASPRARASAFPDDPYGGYDAVNYPSIPALIEHSQRGGFGGGGGNVNFGDAPPAVITAGPARLDRKRSPARRTVTRGIDVSSSPRATAAISRTSCARLASTAWRFSRPVRHPPPGNTSTRWIASRGGHSPIPRYSPSRWWAARRTPLRCLPTPPPSAPSWTPSRRPRFSGANFADSTRRRRLRNDRRRRAARPSGSITESPPVRRRAREANQSQRRRRLCAGTRMPRTAGG